MWNAGYNYLDALSRNDTVAMTAAVEAANATVRATAGDNRLQIDIGASEISRDGRSITAPNGDRYSVNSQNEVISPNGAVLGTFNPNNGGTISVTNATSIFGRDLVAGTGPAIGTYSLTDGTFTSGQQGAISYVINPDGSISYGCLNSQNTTLTFPPPPPTGVLSWPSSCPTACGARASTITQECTGGNRICSGSPSTLQCEATTPCSTGVWSWPSSCPTTCGATASVQTQICSGGGCLDSQRESRTCDATAACQDNTNDGNPAVNSNNNPNDSGGARGGGGGGGAGGGGTPVSGNNNINAANVNNSSTNGILASLLANPPVINQGQSSILSWNSVNADSCTGFGFTAGGPSGSRSTGALNILGTYNYLINCSRGAENSPPAGASVEVLDPNASIARIYAYPQRVNAGEQSTISWSVSNVRDCTITKNNTSWKSDISTSGSVAETITGRTVYTLSGCTNSENTVLPPRSAIVNILTAATDEAYTEF